MIDLLNDAKTGTPPPAATEVAPGRWTVLDVRKLGRMCLARWRPNRDGTHSLVPVTGNWVVINRDLLRRLGMEGGRNTLMRLARATPPFVRVVQRAPRLHLLDLDSLAAHDEATRAAREAGREFWSGDNLRRFQAARMQEG